MQLGEGTPTSGEPRVTRRHVKDKRRQEIINSGGGCAVASPRFRARRQQFARWRVGNVEQIGQGGRRRASLPGPPIPISPFSPTSMLLLALETATDVCSVAVADG
ncbi:MAG: hypothetical protein R3247_12825, partial [Rhodothermales bacterium]|nr:hypothetical protein [Rhodothermales bacterium]